MIGNPFERFSLDGKTALVTGASKGIGAAVARTLAGAGADLAAAGRDEKALAALVDEVTALGRRCVPIIADLESVDGALETAHAALGAFPAVDVLVNNAAIAIPEPALETSVESFERIMAVNLRAPFVLARTLAPGMIERRMGKIINISSAASLAAHEDHAAYGASKAGLNMLTQVMAAEWSRFNVQCNAVAPTVILTPMGLDVWGPREKGDPMRAKIPLRRFGEPVEVADLVLYLASPASDLITGAVVPIDGGYSAV